MMPRTVRVLLLEPDVWRFQGIARYLTENAAFEVFGEPRAERALDAALRQLAERPEVILLAHRLIEDFGHQVFERLRAAHSGSPILVHGESRSVETTAALLAAGASGYFVLTAAQHQLIEAIRVVSGGRIWASREAVLQSVRRSEAPAPVEQEATLDEQMLLTLLFEGLANKEIAARLAVAEVTVKARLSRLYRRYGVTSRMQLVATMVKPDAVAHPRA